MPKYKLWTEDDIFWLTKMRGERKSCAEIAEELDRTSVAVKEKAKRLGIKKNWEYKDD